jgi:methionyl-tRNA formyltransferase
LHDRLATLGATLIVETLQQLARGTLVATAQPADGATYAKKLDKDEARIDWTQAADVIARRIRAFNPAPGAWTELDGERIRCFDARADAQCDAGTPGDIVHTGADGIVVASGAGRVRLLQLQWPGGKPLSAAQIASGRALVGRRFA